MMSDLSIEDIINEVDHQVNILLGAERHHGSYRDFSVFLRNGHLEFGDDIKDDDPTFIGYFSVWPDGNGYTYWVEWNGRVHWDDVEVDER